MFISHRLVFTLTSSSVSVSSLQAAQRELERQRKEEYERRKRGELQVKKEQEQDEIIKLKAKKRSLEMELEAVVSPEQIRSVFTENTKLISYLTWCMQKLRLNHPFLCFYVKICFWFNNYYYFFVQGNKQRQISDRLRDIQNEKKVQETELDLNLQRKETRQQDIYTLHKQIEVCVFGVSRLRFIFEKVLVIHD